MSSEKTLYDVLGAVPLIWSLIGKRASLDVRLVSRESRNLHDAACLALSVHVGRAASHLKASLQLGHAAILDALANLTSRGCRPLQITVTSDCEATLCTVLREAAQSATRVAVLGGTRLGERLGPTLAACAPQLQQLVLEVSEPCSAKGVDRLLSNVGHRLRSLELRLAARATLPAVGLEDCTALEELRLVLDTHALAPLGPLRMRGDEAPPAVSAIASLGSHLHSLELLGPALPRLLDPPHRLVGLSDLTALTRLRVDMPPGFLAPTTSRPTPSAEAVASGFTAVAATAAAFSVGAVGLLVGGGEERAAELRWRAVPLAASLTSLTEVQLGRSYECSVYDMAVLSRAPQLALLACRNIVMPPVWALATAAAAWSEAARTSTRCGRPPPPPIVPLPPRLRELQVRRLPCAPVLASLESLPPPGLQVLKCRAFDKAAAAAGAAAVAAVAATVAEVPSSRTLDEACLGGGAGSSGGGPADAPPPRGEVQHAAAAAAATKMAAKGYPGMEGLRLALVGSSCDAESLEADPWVADVALAAFRLVDRLLFARVPPLPPPPPLAPPSNSGPMGRAAPLQRCEVPGVALPALLVRPFERGGAAGAGGTALRGPYAGAWLSALAPLGSSGLAALQLRGFDLEAGDLQLLRVAVPELKVVELRGCEVAAEDLLQLRDWLQRPGWRGGLWSDLHSHLLHTTRGDRDSVGGGSAGGGGSTGGGGSIGGGSTGGSYGSNGSGGSGGAAVGYLGGA